MPERDEFLTSELEGVLIETGEVMRELVRLQVRLRPFTSSRTAKAAGWDKHGCGKALAYLRAAEKKLARAMCEVVRPVSDAKGVK